MLSVASGILNAGSASGDSATAHNLFQWRNEHAAALDAYLISHGKPDPPSVEVHSEIYVDGHKIGKAVTHHAT
jgi:hypothetical protein